MRSCPHLWGTMGLMFQHTHKYKLILFLFSLSSKDSWADIKANLRHLALEYIDYQGVTLQDPVEAQLPGDPVPWTRAGWSEHNSSYQRTQHLVHSRGSVNRSGLIFPQNFAKNRTSKQTLDLILTHVFYGMVFRVGSKRISRKSLPSVISL